MNEQFLKDPDRPFLAAPRLDRYHATASIEYARATLARCIERAEGPAMLMGPAGTGKTLLCHVLADAFAAQMQVAMLASTRLCTRRALLQAISYEIGLPFRELAEGELRLALVDHLKATDGRPLLVLIDEAHAMPLRLLEEVRALTNLAEEGQPRVRLVLAGLPSLEERFTHPKLESFSQRIAARCYLEPMSREETYSYIAAQLAACKSLSVDIFDDEARDCIFRASDGIGRLVNQICDHSLVLALEAGKQVVDGDAVDEAWADLQQMPVPLQVRGTDGDAGSEAGVIEFGSLDDDDFEEVETPMPEREATATADPEPEPASMLTIELPVEEPGDRRTEVEETPEVEAIVKAEAAFEPAGTIVPDIVPDVAVQTALHPLFEEFAEEEVVVDVYAPLQFGAPPIFRPTASLECEQDHNAGAVLVVEEDDADAAVVEIPVRPAEEQATVRMHDPDADYDPVYPDEPAACTDEDAADRPKHMLVIEDEPVDTQPVRRLKYRQLFANLRGD